MRSKLAIENKVRIINLILLWWYIVVKVEMALRRERIICRLIEAVFNSNTSHLSCS